MNGFHQRYSQSKLWRQKLENEILPWSLNGVDLGDKLLEIGPGPGLTTDWLRHRYRDITCLELDPRLARSLSKRTADTNVTVQLGDATAMPFRDQTFSTVVSFTMLHHIPSLPLQDLLLAEAYRVLKPGGVFAGVPSYAHLSFRGHDGSCRSGTIACQTRIGKLQGCKNPNRYSKIPVLCAAPFSTMLIDVSGQDSKSILTEPESMQDQL